MYCPNCGKQLEPEERFCTECGTPRGKEYPQSSKPSNVQPSKKESPEEAEKKGNELCLYSIACTVGGYFIIGLTEALHFRYGSMIGILSSLLSLAGFILMIICRVKYPKNVFGKILMWVYIALFLLTVIGTVVAIIAFVWFCYACTDSSRWESCRSMG